LLILYGQAGTGKSEVIKALKFYFKSKCLIASPTAKAGFSIGGSTLHSLLKLPTTKLKEKKELSTA
jgi:ATP-dependent DNA helicase PIF1